MTTRPVTLPPTAAEAPTEPRRGRLKGLGRRTVHNARVTRVRGLNLLLWALVIAGPVLGVAAMVAVVTTVGSSSAAAADTETIIIPASSASAEGFAELYLATYVNQAGRGNKDSLEAFFSRNDTALSAVTPGLFYASRTVSLGAEEISEGYFAVTVGAEVMLWQDTDPEADQVEGWVPGGIRFYQVGVHESDAGWVATGYPTQITAPPVLSPPTPQVRWRPEGITDGSLEEATLRFATAYLTGQGEIVRYVAPGLELEAIDPAPFVTVELAASGSTKTDDGELVSVLVEATDAGGRVQILQYDLEFTRRDDRWEVTRFYPAAPINP